MYEGDILSDYEFDLFEYNNNENIISRTCKGDWTICDNGYLNWSTTIPPSKEATKLSHLIFSEWVESIRKDIKCAFGILKGRFHILKYGLRFPKVIKIDKLFKTLCALHNFLIKFDELDMNWMGIEENLEDV